MRKRKQRKKIDPRVLDPKDIESAVGGIPMTIPKGPPKGPGG